MVEIIFHYVDPANHSGGLAVLWNNDTICASILRKDQRIIHMLVHDLEKKHNILVSGVYAPPQSRNKDPFWNHLLQLNNAIDYHSVLLAISMNLQTQLKRKEDNSILVEDLNALIILRIESMVYQFHIRVVPTPGRRKSMLI